MKNHPSHSKCHSRSFGLLTAAFLMVAVFECSSLKITSAEAQESINSDDIVRSILSRANRNDSALGEAIATLIRLNRPKDANALIQSIDAAAVDAQRLATIHQSLGSAAMIRLLAEPQIDEASRETLRKLSQSDQELRSDPKMLDAAAKQILSVGSAKSPDQIMAMRRLAAGGLASIKAIVENLMRSNPSEADRLALRIALQVDNKVGDAIVPWIMYGTAAQVTRATGLLAQLHRDENTLALAIGSKAVEQFRAGEMESIEMQHSDAHRTNWSTDSIVDAFSRQRQSHRQTSDVDQVQFIWLFQQDDLGGSMKSVRSSRIEALYRRDADLSAGLRRILPASSDGFAEAVVAHLSYLVLIDRDWGDPAQIETIQKSIPMLADDSFLLRVFQASVQLGDSPATLACVRLADAASTPTSMQRLQLLTESLAAPRPQIRFEAAIALEGGDNGPADSYAGQSVARRILAEATRLDRRPTVILVETRTEIIGSLQQRIGQTSYQVEVVSSVKKLIERLAAGGDIRLVLSKRQLVDMGPIELVDRVHRMPAYHDLPIVFFRDPGIDDDLQIYSATGEMPLSPDTALPRSGASASIVSEVAYPRTPEAIDRFIRDATRSRRLPMLSDVDRRIYAQQALQAIR